MSTPTQQKTYIQSKALSVSVLICSFNGEKRIGACLKSLSEQTYGKENFEIIVVDDGSTDKTAAISRNFDVRVIRFEKNKGIPIARNAGLYAAKGEIVVFIDDDCVADHYWLESLINVFKDETIVAVGGKIVALLHTTIAERYMEATGYGNPSREPKSNRSGLVDRLFAYFSTMIYPITMEKNIVNVQSVYTANAGYRKKILLDLGGFDESLKTSEDSDISARIKFNGGRIVYAPNAIVKHRHYKNISKVIHEPYRRAQNTLQFYLKERRIPPVFPMPVLCATFIFISLFFYKHVFFLVTVVALLPVVLYGWWAIRTVREHKPEYMCYGYIQLVVEGAAIIGFLKGLFQIILHRTPLIRIHNLKQ